MHVSTCIHAIIVIKQKNTKHIPIIILGKKKRIDFLAGTGQGHVNMKLPESGPVSRIPYLTKYKHTLWIFFPQFFSSFIRRQLIWIYIVFHPQFESVS